MANYPAIGISGGRLQRVGDEDALAAYGVANANALIAIPRLYSFLWNGVDEYIQTDTSELAFERTDPFSVCYWAKYTVVTGSVCGRRTAGATGTGWNVGAGAGGAMRFALRSGSTLNDLTVDSPTGYNDGTWRHFAVTYDGSSTAAGVSWYVNGAGVAENILTDTLTTSIIAPAGTYFTMGAITGGGFYAGRAMELQVYDVELTSGEVGSVYNAAIFMAPQLLTTAPSLVKYMRLGTGDLPPVAYDARQGGVLGECVNMDSQTLTRDTP